MDTVEFQIGKLACEGNVFLVAIDNGSTAS
jgi:hypothetical protein